MAPAVSDFVDYISSLHETERHMGVSFFVHTFLKGRIFFSKNEQEWQKQLTF